MRFIGKSVLLEEREERVLVIGDLHIGYEQGIHQAGVATSFIADTCQELEELFIQTGPVQICVLLGDVIHRFAQADNDEWRGVRAVFEVLHRHCIEIIIVRGNHDLGLAPLAREFNARLVDSLTWKGYCCVHGDRDLSALYEPGVHTWIAGHGHPAFCLQEGAKRELYKCFLEGRYTDKNIILVPSFFSGVIGTDVCRYMLTYPWNLSLKNFELYLIEGGEVLPFGLLSSFLK